MTIWAEEVFRIILTIFLLIFAVIYLYYKWAFYYWHRRGVESVPASIPFGNASQLLLGKTSFAELFTEIYTKYKAQKLRYVGFYLFAQPTLVILDISLIKTILTKDFQYFTDRGIYVSEDQPLTGHLFGLRGEKWKHLRAKLTPTFTSGKMKMMFETFLDCSNSLKVVIDDIISKDEPIVDIKDVVERYTTDVFGSCAFGLNCDSLQDPHSEFRKFGKGLMELSVLESLSRAIAVFYPQIVDIFGIRMFNKYCEEFIMKVVTETIQYREKNNIQRNDFMHLLIQIKNNVQDGQTNNTGKASCDDGLTVVEIAAQALLFFLGGFETSSATLSFCLYELATNPDLQEKLRNEIKTVLKQHSDIISYDAITEMSYMHKCIQETLRKYPPFALLLRECTKDYTLPDSNVTIEKGVRVFIPAVGVHKDPQYYPNPEKFDPERFSMQNSSKRDQFAWLGFGEGPRSCIAMRFALLQIKVALTVLLKDYTFSLSSKTKTPLVLSTRAFLLETDSTIWLNVDKSK